MESFERSTTSGVLAVDPTLDTVPEDGSEEIPHNDKSFQRSRLQLNIQPEVMAEEGGDTNDDEGILGAVIDFCGEVGGKDVTLA